VRRRDSVCGVERLSARGLEALVLRVKVWLPRVVR
jgi:hypothetical protein